MDDGAGDDSDPEGLDSSDDELGLDLMDEESEGELTDDADDMCRKLMSSPLTRPSPLLPLTERPADASLQAPTREPPPSHHIHERSRNIPHNPRYPVRGRLGSIERTFLRPSIGCSILLSLLGFESISIPKNGSSGTYRSWTLLSTVFFGIIRKSFREILETRNLENADRGSGFEYEIDEYRFSHQFPFPNSA